VTAVLDGRGDAAPRVASAALVPSGTLAGGQPRSAGSSNTARPRPGILLDRDGTIIVDHGHVGSVDRVEFVDGAAAAIASFNRAGIPVAVVTNQSGIARGLYGIDDVAEVHLHIAAGLAEHGARIDLFLFCPYHPAGVVAAFARTSEDRKPRPGMAWAAAAALNLDLRASWVVGDRPEDVGLAEAVGASAIYLGDGRRKRRGVWPFPSLAAAAPFILERIAA
jgi:histidinol-phosphate phosphatase family protein